MNGPVHLAKQPRGSLEVELLRHARAERPTAGELARLAAALGLGTTAATATAAESAMAASETVAAGSGHGIEAAHSAAGTTAVSTAVSTAVGRAVAVRWLLLGGACLVVGAGAIAGNRSLRQGGISIPTVDSDTQAQLMVLSSASEAMSGAERSRPGSDGPQLATAPVLASLGPEISMLDRARSLIDSGQPKAALELLDAYDIQFPAGALAPEARVIRVQALLQSGKRANAVELGSEVLLSAPASPHAHKIRQLLGAGEDGYPRRAKQGYAPNAARPSASGKALTREQPEQPVELVPK